MNLLRMSISERGLLAMARLVICLMGSLSMF